MPPTPVTAYDTCRRMFLGHLPPSCTRQDIMTLIKTRTRATPGHIDIALAKRAPQIPTPGENKKEDADDDDEDQEEKKQQKKPANSDSDDDDDDVPKKKKKNNNNNNKGAKKEKKPLRPCRGFAHVTVEGMKSVIETLQGAQIHGQNVVAKPAKPHFLWRIEKVKRDREREEERKKEELEKLRSQEGYGEIDQKTKALIRPFDAAKQRFATIASEIAAKARKVAKERKERMKRMNGGGGGYHQYGRGAGAGAAEAPTAAAGQRRGRDDNNSGKPRAPPNSAAAKKAAPPAPAPAPEPSKTDRKLSALEARLAALQAKLKK